MKYLHSLNTQPFNINLYNIDRRKRILGTVVYYALSVAYLKRMNQPITLYTDDWGYELLHKIPYEEIKQLPTEIYEVHPRFWAAAKMYSIALEDVPVVHIDGDVFIKKESLLDTINNSDYDVIVQNYETGDWYKQNSYIFWKDQEFSKKNGTFLDQTEAFNTGIFGFKNKELKDDFITKYKNLVIYFSEFQRFHLDRDTNLTPDLISEQHLIHNLVKNSDYKALILLDHKNINKNATEIGYQHVITMQKYNYIDKCEEILKKIDPELYETVKEVCDNIKY